MIGGRNIIIFICTFVGINAVCEMIVSTVVAAAVGALCPGMCVRLSEHIYEERPAGGNKKRNQFQS